MMNEFLKVLREKNILLTGADPGNTSSKFSFLNDKGDIESFSIPTVIAEARQPNTEISDHRGGNVSGERRLYVHLKSEAVINEYKNLYWYVGEYAKNKDKNMQPSLDKEGHSVDKFDSTVHIVTLLVGLAVSALKAGKEKVNVPLSTGLPIEEHKRLGGSKYLEKLKGVHVISFYEGEYKDKIVELNIEDGVINVEGITSTLALEFDINNAEIKETNLIGKIGNEFILNDLGAGTQDVALYTEDGLEPSISTSKPVGTNQFIDDMIAEIEELPQVREAIDSMDLKPFSTREKFMRDIIIPETEKMITNENYEPKYTFNWGIKIKNVDITSIVNTHISKYADSVLNTINEFSLKYNVDKIVIVGGGLLFGYSVFKEHKDTFIYPDNLLTSAAITSRAYLIANYSNITETLQSA